ncbi:MraY family glycosyltransferase [Anaeromyxobacter diazotrophicus]|uniref:Glycosyl transferase n=1 Tax=Anaeromyxobacter diazotrophicus TaxID=2590199 RepID=A0A7I9VH17_9BACT|nr:glycosyltransferase family 4 protein [Anaeromyxobacter diazotrophicus]GEJ55430.1 glycosyl transferase [Anaeromyxobacter diazotrophicus]
MMITGIALFATAGAISFSVAYACRNIAVRLAILDEPNGRSAHATPKPRLGGVGVMGAFLVAGVALVSAGSVPSAAMGPLAATGVIACLGFIDDLRQVPARWRFVVQLAAASTVVAFRFAALPQAAGPLLGSILPPWVLAPLAVLWIVWLTNLYNFMDGIDGLAGGQGLIGGLAIAAAAWLCGASATAALAVAVAGASLGFLFLNFPPSSIFMGDVGSTAIGFFFGCVPLLPDRQPVSFDIVAVALSLFVLDATVTLVRRVIQGQRWYEPHRSHHYQRPLALGIEHRAITLSAYLGFALLGGLAVLMALATAPVRLALLMAAALVFVVAAQVVRGLERAHAMAAERVERPDADRRAA